MISTASNNLPQKENALFKRVLKCYEQKQYKNGLKFAKQILSNPKFSEHGETQSVKGLILNCMGRKEEAYDYVRRGLRNDLKSHVCWHVYGLLQRSDKHYDGAIKAYRNALRWDPDNIQILRDLSLLQIQMRDLEGYKETRYRLFQLRPTQRASWIGFAMSYHLLNDYQMTLKILDEFRKTQQKCPYDYEQSELFLYENMVIRESGHLIQALTHIENNQNFIFDKYKVMEIQADLKLKLEMIGGDDQKTPSDTDSSKIEKISEAVKSDDEKTETTAEQIYLNLIDRNQENSVYYLELEKIYREKNKNCDQETILTQMYESMMEKYPKAQMPKRLVLNVTSGENFKRLVDNYLQRGIRKGTPPLFLDLKSLYDQSDEKVGIIENLITSYIENLKSCCNFTGDASSEPASAIVWTYHFLAQHHDFLGHSDQALNVINEALDHTPTLVELYLVKSQILKNSGDLVSSSACLYECQSLDTADRYLNCACAEGLLLEDRVEDSCKMSRAFTHHESAASTETLLNEMQCMWWQVGVGWSYFRRKQFGQALKLCWQIDRHFTEIIDDQFDFHTYCLRKMTLSSYVDMLRLVDGMRSHKFYTSVAKLAIRIYCRIHDFPLSQDDAHNNLHADNLSTAELKKLRNKQKKAKLKADAELAANEQANARKEMFNKNLANGTHNPNKKDDEMDGPIKVELIPEKLETVGNPLEKAENFLIPLQLLRSNHCETHWLAFEVAFRKRKLCLMLQAIKRFVKALKHNMESTELKTSSSSHQTEKMLIVLHKCLVLFEMSTTMMYVDVDSKSTHIMKQLVEKEYNENVLNCILDVDGKKSEQKNNVSGLKSLIFKRFESCQTRNEAFVSYIQSSQVSVVNNKCNGELSTGGDGQPSIKPSKPHLFALYIGCQLRYVIGKCSDKSCFDALFNFDENKYAYDLEICKEIYESFGCGEVIGPGLATEFTSKFAAKCQTLFPISSIFKI